MSGHEENAIELTDVKDAVSDDGLSFDEDDPLMLNDDEREEVFAAADDGHGGPPPGTGKLSQVHTVWRHLYL